MRRILFLFTVLSMTLFITAGCEEGEHKAEDGGQKDAEASKAQKNDYLWTLAGKSGTYSDSGGLVLNELQENVVYFAERPDRKTGTLGMSEFLKMWESPGTVSSLKSDPPNALLTTIDGSGAANISVVELTGSSFVNGSARFTVDVREGLIPSSFAAATIVIDGLIDTVPMY